MSYDVMLKNENNVVLYNYRQSLQKNADIYYFVKIIKP